MALSINEKGQLIGQIDSEYKTIRDKTSSGRAFAPGIVIAPGGELSSEAVEDLLPGKFEIESGAAMSISDRGAAELEQYDKPLRDNWDEIPALYNTAKDAITDRINEAKSEATGKLVLAGLGLVALLVLLRR